MTTDRRSLLLSMPALLLGLQESEDISWAQARPGVAADVADFWAKRMGVPAKMLLRSAGSPPPTATNPNASSARQQPELLSHSGRLDQTRGSGIEQLGGRQPIIETSGTSAGVVGFGREPIFFHLDEDQHALIPATEVPTQKLHASGDTIVELRMNRLRLSPNDAQQFQRFASGGIYLDMEQQQQQAKNATGQAATSLPLASSVLGAFFASVTAGKNAPAKTTKTTGSGKSASTVSAASSAGADVSAATIPLQETTDSQSIALSNGLGKLAFSCFMKDRRKSAFGTFVSAFLELGSNSNKLSYLPMLSMPVVAAPALVAMRALVANLQMQGLDHQWILGCGPLDVASTASACSSVRDGLRFRTGTYIAVPREHSDLVRNKLSGLKLQDGFLVPKDATELDVYDAMPRTLEGATYLSMQVNVKPTRLGGCVVPVPA